VGTGESFVSFVIHSFLLSMTSKTLDSVFGLLGFNRVRSPCLDPGGFGGSSPTTRPNNVKLVPFCFVLFCFFLLMFTIDIRIG